MLEDFNAVHVKSVMSSSIRDGLCEDKIDRSFRNFCVQTSLHGWHYIVGGTVDRTNNTRNYLWTVIVTLSMITAGTFLYKNTWVKLSTHVNGDT